MRVAAIEECSPAEAEAGRADDEMESASEHSRESTVAMQGDESCRSSVEGDVEVDVEGPSEAPPHQATCAPLLLDFFRLTCLIKYYCS